ncbi:hypothetical protein JVU11DRAFT_5606 [Chiua virens]|nr:hypothetical protein JVU11DRAFT_5606 [Chiua virens]
MVKLLFGPAHTIYCFLFSSFTLAALQNVTVDDAVLTGAVVFQYLPLPSTSSWNIGNNCSACTARLDASQAYNGTWHDSTYYPGGVYKSFEFNFTGRHLTTGSSLYIYFILANTIPNATVKSTELNFFMDGSSVGTYQHSPMSSTDYQYNVAVYVNDSVPFGTHAVTVEPVYGNNLELMLFDYLVYTYVLVVKKAILMVQSA